MMTKAAVVLLLINIASHRKDMRIILWTLLGFCVAYNISCKPIFTWLLDLACSPVSKVILTLLLGCQPFAANWNQTMPGAKCLDRQKYLIPFAAIDLVASFAIFLAPFPMIWR